MAAHTSVWHDGHKSWWDIKRALKAIANCAAVWDVEGESVRFPTLSEQQKLHAEYAKRQEPLPYSEVHGLRYDPAASGVVATRMEKRLIFEAHQFVAEQAA